MKTARFKVSLEFQKIFSENNYLKPGLGYRGGRKPYAYLYKHKDAEDFQTSAIWQMIPQVFEFLQLGELVNPKVYLTTLFHFKYRFGSRDLGNMSKMYEDAIKVAIQIDDKDFISHEAWKIESQDSEIERIETWGMVTYDG